LLRHGLDWNGLDVFVAMSLKHCFGIGAIRLVPGDVPQSDKCDDGTTMPNFSQEECITSL